MANDVSKAITANDIKQGTVVVATSRGVFQKKDESPAIYSPVITDIDDKYDARFDDKSYYTT